MSEQLITTPCLFGETGNLLLERELGRGGMGGVYMGRDKMLDRAVAVKVMLKEYGSDAEFVEKFKREAQSAARLIHPNIAQIYSYGISDGMPYIAMELVAGGSLYTLMNNSPGGIDVPRVLKICEQVAQALRCASDQGVIHGDIKPENILIDSNGNAKLVDFGLAAMQKETDEIWGTPYYISPEKVQKEAVDYRSDMYSLGGTLYHALTGVAPFEGDDAASVVRKRFEGPCRKPSEVRPGLSPQIDALVMKMLAFARKDRFPTFEALLEAFKRVMTTGLAGAPAQGAASSVQGAAKRKLTVKRPGAKRFKTHDEEEDADDSRSSRMSRLAADDSDEEESSGGKLRNTILAVFGGVILVGGLLAWYVYHDQKVREAEERAQIAAGFTKSRNSIESTAKLAEEYQKKFDDFAGKAIEECERVTDELGKLFPANIASMLKPPMSKELLDAMAAVKEGSEAAGETNAPPAAVQQAAAPVPRPAVAQRPAPSGFRPPQGDELDQNSPEYQDYLKAKAEWEEAHPNGQEGGAQAAAAAEGGSADAAAPAAAEEAAPAASQQLPPPEITKIHELWDRAYSCKACALIIHHRIDKLLTLIAQSSSFPEENRDTLSKIEALAQSVRAEYDAIKGSEEFNKVQKGISFIKSKGARTVEDTVKRLRSERLAAEREAKKKAEEAAEKQRQKDLAEKKKKLIEDETKAINEKFEALATAGVFRQLDWNGAKRQLNAMKGDFDSAEAAVVADLVIRKVEAMQLVHEIMIRNLKNYTFEKGKDLKGMKVVEVDEREMKLLKKDGKTTKKMNWPKFYREYHGNLNELFNTFVVRGRKNGTPKLRPKDWSVAMMGAALTMRVICADDPAAPVRGEAIAKEAVRQFEIYRPLAQEFFPDIDFSDVKPEE